MARLLAARLVSRLGSSHGLRRARLALAAGAALAAAPAAATEPPGPGSSAEVRQFIAEMSERHGFAAAELEALFEEARFSQRVLDLFAKPAEAKPWFEYRELFVTATRIERGGEFWERHAPALERARTRFGVPPEVVVAIIGVETNYGRTRGRIRALDALTTLAFRYPRRAAFFRDELEAFLLLAREEGMDARRVMGSYAGALGVPQFIPTSYRAYAVDFDADGRRDLIGSVDDAIGSVANYLARHGWRRGQPVAALAEVTGAGFEPLLEGGLKPRTRLGELRGRGLRLPGPGVSADELVAVLALETRAGAEYWVGFDNFYAITRYNPSKLYGMAVHQLALALRGQRTVADSGTPAPASCQARCEAWCPAC